MSLRTSRSKNELQQQEHKQSLGYSKQRSTDSLVGGSSDSGSKGESSNPAASFLSCFGRAEEEGQGGEQHPRGHMSCAKQAKRLLLTCYRPGALLLRKGRTLLAVCLSVAVMLALVWILRTPARMVEKEGRQHSYAVYIDGGSSGTRAHVFEYRHSVWPAYVQLNLPEKVFSVEPGLSSYAGHPEQAAAALKPLLEFAYKEVPPHQWGVTPVHLMTTAGLRLLPPADADAILQHCTQLLAGSHFLFRPRWARIIDGDDEGLYAWAAANYVSGALEEASHHHHSRKEALEVQDHPSQFNGVLELGGASFQVTFIPASLYPTKEHTGVPVPLPGITRPLFTHSYLGLGMDAALRKGTSIVLSQTVQGQALRETGGQQRRLLEAEGAPQPLQQQQQSLEEEGEHSPTQGGSRTLKQQASGGTAGAVLLDPCLPVGYQEPDGRHGSGDYEGCMAVVQQVLPKRMCGGESSTSDSSARSSSGGDSMNSDSHAAAAAHGGRLRDIVGLGSASGGSLSTAADSSAGAGQQQQQRQLQGEQQQQETESSGRVSKVLHSLLGGGGDTETGAVVCTLGGVYLPPVRGTNFLAVENLFWTARALGLPELATLAEVAEAGKAHCAIPWSTLHFTFAGHVPHQFITRYCFGAAYVVALLHERLGLGLHDRSLHFTNSISRPVRTMDWGQEEAEEHSDDGVGRHAGDGGVSVNRQVSAMHSSGSLGVNSAGSVGSRDRGLSADGLVLKGLGGSSSSKSASSEHSSTSGVSSEHSDSSKEGDSGHTVAVGLSWVVGAMVVETMRSHHHHHHVFRFEGGLGDMDASLALQNAEGWLAHHITLSVLLVGALVCFMWRWKAVQRRSAPSRAGGGSVGPSSALGVFLSTR